MIRNHTYGREGNNEIVLLLPHIHCPKCNCGDKCPWNFRRSIKINA